MKGWRAKIGVVCPGPSVVVESDFNSYAPEGVGISTVRIPFGGPTPENLMKLADQLGDACSIYKGRPHDVIVFACTSGSLIGGYGFDQECIRRIEESSGSKGLTTTTAVIEGFKALGVSRAAVITPYPDDTNEAEKKFLEDHGITVTSIDGINPTQSYIPDIEPHFLYKKVKELDISNSDVIFISCTGLNTLSIIETLEEDFGLPVITSNQVSLWGALRHAKVGTKIPELGKLFTL